MDEENPVGRLGGEEFAICLVNRDLEAGLAIAEKLRESVATTPLSFEGATIQFTCSIGVTLLVAGATAEKLLSSSDRALYRAKNSGRNRVEFQGCRVTGTLPHEPPAMKALV